MGSDLEILQKVLQTATGEMSEGQLNWHPEGKWSSAEILEHLYLTYTGTIKGLERVLGAGEPFASVATMKHRLQTLVVFGLNYLPSGRTAPSNALPRGLSALQVRADIHDRIAAMDKVIQECERRFGRRPLLDHSILGPLTAKQWRRFHLIHGRHHAKQIAGLRRQMEGAVDSPASH